MYDAVNWQTIPADPQMVAGYVDGEYAWPAAAWAHFPHAAQIHVSVIPPGNVKLAGVIDVENGAATIADGVAFCRAHHAAGTFGVIYIEASRVAALRTALGDVRAGLWVADWTGKAHRLADMKDVVAVQYQTITNEYDVSEVFDGDWHPQRH
jgi:hypothetical protein